MESASATDVCDGITVHRNATIIEQTGPKLVYSVVQRRELELMADHATRWVGLEEKSAR